MPSCNEWCLALCHRLLEHVEDPNKLPILIFPEGTCINNTSVMQFKKGTFEVGGTIYPVAIKVRVATPSALLLMEYQGNFAAGSMVWATLYCSCRTWHLLMVAVAHFCLFCSSSSNSTQMWRVFYISIHEYEHWTIITSHSFFLHI